MRHAHSTFPWFLALILSSLSACDDLFSVPACEFDSNSVLCMQQKDGVGGQAGGDMSTNPAPTSDLDSPPTMKPAVSFRFATSSPLSATRKWVGVNSEKFILFADQSSADTANMSSFKLDYTPPKPPAAEQWNLISRPCATCISLIRPVNLNADKILASKTLFFAVKPDSAYLIKPTGDLTEPINVMAALGTNYRPFVSPSIDLIAYQKKVDNNLSLSEINYFTTPSQNQATAFANRTSMPMTTYYAIGDLDGPGMKISDNEMLIFEDKILTGAYRMDNFPTINFDPELTTAVAMAINNASGASNTDRIRSAFIADLNNDGYIELIFARGQKIYIISYNPRGNPGSKFNTWSNSGFNIPGIDRTETLSAVDLNNDEYLDLAIETPTPNMVHFYINNKR